MAMVELFVIVSDATLQYCSYCMLSRSQQPPAVSVIIPSYNTAGYIAESLESVFAQTFTDFEVLVINDDSPDTLALEQTLQPYQDRIRYFRKSHSGLAGTRNFGISEAKGEFIALLDSDDLWEPDYLKILVGKLRSDPTLDIVYPNALMFGIPQVDGRLYMDMYPWDGEPGFEAMVRRQCCVFGLVTARREALLRAGLYDSDMPCCEDYDLWLRAIKSGSRFGFSREVLVRYRRHTSSLSANHSAITAYSIYSLRKIRNQFSLSASENKAVDDTLKELYATQAMLEGKDALLLKDYERAIEKLTAANDHFHSLKTKAVIAMLRLVPGILRFMYDARNRSLESKSPVR